MDSKKNNSQTMLKRAHNLLKLLYAYWMKFAKVLATVNSFIILFIFYFVIIGVYALVGKIFRFFTQKNNTVDSFWSPKEKLGEGLEDLKYQF